MRTKIYEFESLFHCLVTNHGIDVAQLDWRLSDDPVDEDTNDDYKDPEYRKGVKCKIFLGCTSNLISSGVRETIRFLIEHKMVSVQ